MIDHVETTIATNSTLTPSPTVETSKLASTSKPSSDMPSPTLSTSSFCSGRISSKLDQDTSPIPVHFEKEIITKTNFNQLSKKCFT